MFLKINVNMNNFQWASQILYCQACIYNVDSVRTTTNKTQVVLLSTWNTPNPQLQCIFPGQSGQILVHVDHQQLQFLSRRNGWGAEEFHILSRS
jgi:hypothetical protein